MLPKLNIQNIEFDPNRRILVTSDIHGHLSYFQKLVEKVGFYDEDILIIMGDIIEKGPESLKTLRYIMDLFESKTVIPLIGNVDVWRLHMINDISKDNVADFYKYLLDMRKWFGTSFFDEMTLELGFLCQDGGDVYNAKENILRHFADEIAFLTHLPTLIETQHYIFVHGGLPDTNIQKLMNYNLFDFLKRDNFMSLGLFFEKYVVVGHWPVTLYSKNYPDATPIINKNQKIISIDGGCGIKKDGQLNLMILPNINSEVDKIEFISYDDFPVFTAMSNQNASVDSIHINWVDNKINILKNEDVFSYAEHISTGYKLWIHNDFIYKNGTCCSDYTDYILPVKKGDNLSLIMKTSKGCIVKKDGITGWYYGELQ